MGIRIDSTRPQQVTPRPVTPAPARGAAVPAADHRVRRMEDSFEEGHAHGPSCPTVSRPKLTAEDRQAIDAKVAQLMTPSMRDDKGTTGGVIDVHFHVINKGQGEANGDVSAKSIDDQIAALNEAYKDTGWSFRLASTDRTTNREWYTADYGTDAEREMKQTLRKGEADDLNVYLTRPPQNTLGWATFPEEYKADPLMDGVVILNSSLPGGKATDFNEGDTMTHEVGHWMGLFHTWDEDKDDGRGPTGDEVDDTPVHYEPNYGKPPETTDTAPDEPGFDPVHNYMNYGDDAWLTEFTPGQDARMDAHWQRFREQKPAA